MFIITIVRHTPAWVWSLLAVLVALSVSGVFSVFGHSPAALGGSTAGLGSVLAFAREYVAVHGAVWAQQA